MIAYTVIIHNNMRLNDRKRWLKHNTKNISSTIGKTIQSVCNKNIQLAHLKEVRKGNNEINTGRRRRKGDVEELDTRRGDFSLPAEYSNLSTKHAIR